MLASFRNILRTYDRSALSKAFFFPFPLSFFSLGTMASADFLQFVVTTLFFAPARPPRVLTRSFPLYLPHLPQAIPCSYWALFCCGNLPSLAALYAIPVRQARGLPIRGLSTSKIRLSSDSASRRTPLPLANPSRCRADSGLSPYRTCAHRAHTARRAAPAGAA